MLRDYITEHGPLDERGNPRPAVELLLKAERLAMSARDALGFTPSARAKLGRDTAAGAVDRAILDERLDAAVERGRQTDAGRTIDGAVEPGGASWR